MALTVASAGNDLAVSLERVLRLFREVSTVGDLSNTAAAVLSRRGHWSNKPRHPSIGVETGMRVIVRAGT